MSESLTMANNSDRQRLQQKYKKDKDEKKKKSEGTTNYKNIQKGSKKK